MTSRPYRRLTVPWALLTSAGWVAGVPLVALIGALVLIPLPVRVLRARGDELDLLEPIWLFCALFAFSYLLVPLLWQLDPDAMVSLPGYLAMPANAVVPACALGGAGYIALVAGYTSRPARALGARLPHGGQLTDRQLGVTAAVLVALGLGTTAYAYQTSGGGTPFSGELRAHIVASYSGRGYLTVGFTLLMLSAPVTTLWAARTPSRRRWVLAGALATVAVLLLGGIVGSRLGVLSVIVGSLAVLHYRVRPARPRYVAMAVLLLIVFGVGQSVVRGTTTLSRPLSAPGIVAGTLDGFEFLANAPSRVQKLEWGRPLVEDVVLTYLPRALWHGKPTEFGFVREQELLAPGLFDDFQRGNATFPIGLVAEGYVNFGTFGAVGLPLLTGLLLAAIAMAGRRGDDDYWLIILAWTLPNLFSLMRGFSFGLIALLLAGIVLLPMLFLGRRAATAPG